MEKICPFCSETIKETAIKCKHCGEFLDGIKSIDDVKRKTSTSSLGIFQLIGLVIGVPMFWISIVGVVVVLGFATIDLGSKFYFPIGAAIATYLTYKLLKRMPENIKSNIKVINFKQVISLIVVVVLIFGIVQLANRPASVTYIEQSQPQQSEKSSSNGLGLAGWLLYLLGQEMNNQNNQNTVKPQPKIKLDCETSFWSFGANTECKER